MRRWGRGNGRGRLDVAAVLVVLAASLVVGFASPALAANGTIAGTVRTEVGARPLAGATVEAYGGVAGALYGSATTAADGTFSLSLPAGSFRVRYVDPTGAHTTVYWGGSTAFASAAAVAVTSAGTVTADWTMNAAARLGGTVTSAGDGGAVPGASVEILDASTLAVEWRVTADSAAGAWQRAVKPGAHKLRITDPSGVHVTGYSGGGTSQAGATTISVASGASVGHDVSLHRRPHVKGTVTVSGGGGVGGVAVAVLDASTAAVVATTTSVGDGTYGVDVPAGSYKVQIGGGPFPTAFNGGGATFAAAPTLTLANDSTTVVDAQLATRTMIIGSAFRSDGPVAAITVQVLDPFWGSVITQGTTDAAGFYALGVAPGTYRMRFHDDAGAYADRYSGGSSSWESSTTVTVAAGQVLRLDTTLEAMAAVAGRVTNRSSAPVGGIVVEAVNTANWPLRSATTTADGTYSLTGLPPGAYKLRMRDPAGVYPMTYEGGATAFAAAPSHTLLADRQLTLDLELAEPGALEGKARIGGFGPAVPGIVVIVVDAGTNGLTNLATTKADGSWSIPNMAPGTYKVAYVDPRWVQTSTPSVAAYRPVVVPDHDVVGEGPLTALAGAATFPVGAGATTDAGTQGLVGYHCYPVTHHPGADLHGWHPTSPKGSRRSPT